MRKSGWTYVLLLLLFVTAGTVVAQSNNATEQRVPDSAEQRLSVGTNQINGRVNFPYITTPQALAYFQDFESGNGGYTISGPTSWAYGTPTSGPGSAYSGTSAWATNLTGDYGPNENGYITSPNIDLSSYSGSAFLLSWYQYLDTELGYDYARVEVSNNGGTSWTVVYGQTSGPVDLAWTQHGATVGSSYAVSNFQVRFRLRSDFANNFPGFYVDDIQIDTIPPVSTLLLFYDDFESGLSNWMTTGLWNLESETETCGAMVAPFPNPTKAAYYGQDGTCTYATGSPTTGSLTLNAAVPLPSDLDTVQLTFDSYEETEEFPGYDIRTVDVSTDNGSSWTTAATLTTEVSWYVPMVDLSMYIGSDILIRFTFNSVDNMNNSQLGWLVDAVSIYGTAPDNSLTTTYAGGTLQAGNMFDVTAISDISISGFDVHINGTGSETVEIYYKEGSYVGSETISADWTLWGSKTVTAQGIGNPTHVEISELSLTAGDAPAATALSIPSGETYAFYLSLTSSTNMVHSTGANSYANSDLSVSLGTANVYSFGTVSTPRTWNGTIYYQKFLTPVTVSSFASETTAQATVLRWTTSNEIGNAGFHVYRKTDGGFERLNKKLIVSQVISGIAPQPYEVELPLAEEGQFYLESVDIEGRTRLFGPYASGETYGVATTMHLIDWHEIGRNQQSVMATRSAENLAIARNAFATETTPAGAGIDILVDQDGLYRITYQDLLDFGVDLLGLPVSRLALVNDGQAVPVYINSSRLFRTNTYIEFYGEARESLYGQTNVYTLVPNANLAQRVAIDQQSVPAGVPTATYHETAVLERENGYNMLATNGDPWYDTLLIANGAPFTQDFTVTVDNFMPDASTVRLDVDLWGLTSWDAAPDHHLQVQLNGVQVADTRFDGLNSHAIAIDVPVGLLQNGDNLVTLTVPYDNGVPWDMIYLNSIAITYPRSFVAVADRLSFQATGDVLSVSGLSAADVVVYRQTPDGVEYVKRRKVTANGDGTFAVTFRGQGMRDKVHVSTVDGLLSPTLAPSQPYSDITTGSADYIMISHPNFIDGLTPLVQYHEAQGRVVKIVDVFDIYAQFGDRSASPDAIQAYITYAVNNMGVDYVLLVGGDTYDYMDYLGIGSISFIPTPYGPTDPYIQFAPLDPLLADVDGDELPDVPVGRLPVRTTAELTLLIDKLLLYAAKDYGKSIVMAADVEDDGLSFAQASDSFLDQLSAEWQATRAYIDDLGVPNARTALLDSINNGVALTGFFGHSGPGSWTYSTPPFFVSADVANLTNTGKPTVVVQWGCYNTYHVEPTYDTLSHSFLLGGDNGAAAVVGASTITTSASDAALGVLLMPRLVQPGMSIGQAIQAAKDDLALTQPHLRDVLLGWTLLGDPALVVDSTTP